MTKWQILIKCYCNLLPPFITKGNANFQLEVSANIMQTKKKKIFFFSRPSLQSPAFYPRALLWAMDFRLWSPTFRWCPNASRTLIKKNHKILTHHINFFSLEITSLCYSKNSQVHLQNVLHELIQFSQHPREKGIRLALTPFNKCEKWGREFSEDLSKSCSQKCWA